MKEMFIVLLSLTLGFFGGYVVGKACENVIEHSCASQVHFEQALAVKHRH